MRDQGTIKVGVITHEKTGLELEVNFNQGTRKFLTLFQSSVYTDTSFNDLEKRMLELIDNSFHIEWEPIIAITIDLPNWFQTDFNNELRTSFDFSFDRYYIGKLDQHVKRVNWEIQNEYRVLKMRDLLVYKNGQRLEITVPMFVKPDYGTKQNYYLPYNEILWEKLVVLKPLLERNGNILEFVLNQYLLTRELSSMGKLIEGFQSLDLYHLPGLVPDPGLDPALD